MSRRPAVESRWERWAVLVVCSVVGGAFLLRVGWQWGKVLAVVLHGVR